MTRQIAADTETSRHADSAPLAERLRPLSIRDIIGQDHLLGPKGPIGRMLAAGRLRSLILWGPPGVGKTTIARALANEAGLHTVELSAVMAGVPELRRVIEDARKRLETANQATGLFVDEIHRWNKAQQDALLPHIESGLIVLIGATTENPGFSLANALLSRAPVMTLKPLDAVGLDALARRAELLIMGRLFLEDDARETIVAMSESDGRRLAGLVENAADLLAGEPDAAPSHDAPAMVSAQAAAALFERQPARHDKGGDAHYAILSCFHKSLRGSDPDAALYYAARAIDAGEDPRTILRRLACCAAEDVGMADPQAMVQAMTAWQGFERTGWPEGRIFLAQAIVYIATAPKSNAAYSAFDAALAKAAATRDLAPPPHIVAAPTKLMRAQGLGAGYEYDHDMPDGYSGQQYLPDALAKDDIGVFYQPRERGFERDVRKRIDYWNKKRQDRRRGA